MPLGSWLAPKKGGEEISNPLNAKEEPEYLEDALKAALEIMNDDVKAAEEGLRKGNSGFHKLGMGVVAFMKATMGFEQEIMKEASDRLSEAETHALNDHRRVQGSSHSFQSSIYPVGTEFALCAAEAQLMSAVVGVLNESVTESIKAFYKLRKAYVTLDTILDAEAKFLSQRSGSGSGRTSADGDRQAFESVSTSTEMSKPKDSPKPQIQVSSPLAKKVESAADKQSEIKVLEDEDTDDEEFVDASETLEHHITPMYSIGHLDTQIPHRALANLVIASENEPDHGRADSPRPGIAHDKVITHDPDSDVFSNPLDIFVHSGSNLCFGLLLLLISMIPPAFGKLLYIIGFKGDRERGLRMLWQASKFHNINGSMAGLVLLGYYNGVVGFSDILPDSGDDVIDGYPTEKCQQLLRDMRTRHPQSHLWMLEEARMEASNKRVESAVTLLSKDMTSQLKQIEALAMFEKGLNALYSHQYTICSESFLKCIQLNNWSHALYFYIAAATHVEQYRIQKKVHPMEAKKHAVKAEEMMKQVPGLTGKKRFMAKQLPFDVFVARKVQKWTHRAAERHIPFVDAIGVSPAMEMAYFWNGFKRMNKAQLEYCLERLNWSRTDENIYGWQNEAIDEKAVLALIEAVAHRNLHDGDKLELILKRDILAHDKAVFKGHLKDDWVAPSAHYEMAVLCWEQKSQGKEKIDECREWLEKAAHWEAYDLDARIGLKVTTGMDTLKTYTDKA